MDTPIKELGAPDPELKNSPISAESDEDFDVLRQEVDEGVCYFNGKEIADGAYIQSGGTYLRCDKGIWVPSGPDEPE